MLWTFSFSRKWLSRLVSSRSPNAMSESSFFVRRRDWTEVLSMLSSRTEARPLWDWV